ncbi:phage tail length tape measure family protein [Burkholderia plantarii]|uniref:phage tail tape measure C-terminal domain-containing protein n=1 Tax=Burkholderia plantarii TaxID=41899 RepID=UPI00272D2F39|nr:phage tail tape measure C-terminal domain-containing protein [Burkholderia plantarii]WLE60232.1 phage tail length tape measure family protein [Burkholderia plantarii]
MSDEVGKAVLSVEANIDSLDANLRTGADRVRKFEQTAKSSAGAAADSISSIGASAGDTADKVSAAGQRLLASLQRQVVLANDGKIGWAEYRAAQLGVGDAAAPLIQQLRAAEAAAAAQAAAFGSASTASAQLGESEDQATARIKAMVAASLEQVAAMNAVADSANRAASSVGAVGAASSAASRQQVPAPVRQPASTAASAAQFVPAAAPAAAAVAATAVAPAMDVSGLLSQLDPLGRKLGDLDTAESELRAAFKGGAVDAETFSKALQGIGAQRDAIGKLQDAAEQGTSALSHLSAGGAGAAREVAVLAREAASGNFTRFGSSLSILAQQTGLLALALTPVGIAIGAVVAAIGIAGAAFVSYESKVSAANTAIIASGNYAGVTAGSLLQLADQIGAASGHVGDAAKVLTVLVSSSGVSSGALANLGQAALDMSEVTGTSADKMADYFAQIGDGAKKFAGDTIDKYGLLSEAVYERISDLEKQGDEERAQDELAEALKAAAEKRLAELKGSINQVQNAWEAAGRAALGAGQAFTGALSGATGTLTPEQELAERKNLRAGNLDASNFGISLHDAFSGTSNDSRITQLEAEAAARAKVAAAEAAQAAAAKDGKAAYDALTRVVQAAETPTAKLLDVQQKIIDNWFKLQASNPNSDFLKAHPLQSLLDGATASAHSVGKAAPNNTNNVINGQLKALDDQQKAVEDSLKTSLDHLTSLRAQGLVSLQASLQQAHDLRQAALQDELAITQKAEDVAAGKKQLSALQKYRDEEKKIRQQMVDNDQKTADDIAAAYAKQQAAVKAYTDALGVQLQTQQNAVDIRVNAVSQGSRQTEQSQQVNAIQQQYADRARQLAQQLGKPDGISNEQYAAELSALQQWQTSAIGIVDKGYAAMTAAQGNWANGANKAFQDYEANAADIASQTAKAFTDAFQGIEDALVNFATTGKLNFSSLANSVIADIVRMQVKAAESSLLGSGSGGGLGGLLSQLISGAGASGVSSLGGSLAGSAGGSAGAIDLSGAVDFLASGGPVFGPGTSTSDSIPAMLSNGEGVINAKGMQSIGGAAGLFAINSGHLTGGWRHYASGGAVGASSVPSTTAPAAGGIVVNVIGASSQPEVKRSTASDGTTQIDLIFSQVESRLAAGVASGSGVFAKTAQKTWSLNRTTR